jgi:hypothetical protein
LGAKLQVPGFCECDETAVVCLFGFGWEAAAGKLFTLEVVAYAIAANATASTTHISTGAIVKILLFFTFQGTASRKTTNSTSANPINTK